MERNLDNPEFKCRGGCGFYGNPNWEGYCSLCRKKFASTATSPVSDAHHLTDRFRTHSFSVKPSSTPPMSPSLGRAEPARFYQEFSSFANSLKKSTSQGGESPAKSSQGRSSPDTVRPKGSEKFSIMLRALPRPVSNELESALKNFLQKLHSRTFASIDELSEFVQKFYVKLAEKLNKNNVYSALPSQVREELWDDIETHICMRLYKTAFAHLQDEEADLALHNKLRSLLKEITPVDLDLPPAFADSEDSEENDENMKHLLDDAFLAMIDMTTKTTPQEILCCLSTCCSALFNALRAALSSPPSADDFLPALIYCVIRTNPPQIHSTIAYVERFAIPERILDGERAYFFTNLCCAVRYLNTTDAAAIKSKSKKTAHHEADLKEAAEKGCSVAAVKADHRLQSLSNKVEGELNKRIEEFEKNVAQVGEKFNETVQDITESIQRACTEADNDIANQLLIDFKEHSRPGSDGSQEVLQLYALGTMDTAGVEKLKSSLTKTSSEPTQFDGEQTESTSNPQQPLLIDLESEVSSPS